MPPSLRRAVHWLWDGPAVPPWRSPVWWAQIAPAIIAAVVYVGALANGFAYDDVAIVSNNDWVRHGTVLTRALALPYWPDGALYRPVTSFSYGLDWMLGGGHPLLFHALNVAWYALGAALVARVALRWWPPLAAALAGALFAVQPVHVEAVANVVGRAELLAGVALLALTLVISAPRPLSTARLVAVAILAALAAGAKETGVVAPLIAWATIRLRHDARPGDVGRVSLAALVGVAIPFVERITVLGTLTGDTPHRAFIIASHAQSVALALATIPRALSLLAIPHLPGIDYSPTSAALTNPSIYLVIAGGILLAVGCALLVVHAWRPSPWTWAALFSVATFAPVSNLLVHTGVVLADRTLYGPSIGASLLLGGALGTLLQWPRTEADRSGASRRDRPVVRRGLQATVGAAATYLIVASITYTLQTVGVWHDSRSVFTAMIDRSPTSYRGYYLLGSYNRSHNPERAVAVWADAQRDYSTAISLFDGDPGLFYEAAINALELGDTARALAWLDQSVEHDPHQTRARTTLILLHLRRGETAHAQSLLQAGLSLQPDQRAWRKMLDSLNAMSVGAMLKTPARATALAPPAS
jgi:protein O-mannosyl-transferase